MEDFIDYDAGLPSGGVPQPQMPGEGVGPEQRAPNQEDAASKVYRPEIAEAMGVRYVIHGESIKNRLEEARRYKDFFLLDEAIDDAMCLMEGLPFGKEFDGYNLEDELVASDLLNTFTTKGGQLSHRPETAELKKTVENIMMVEQEEVAKFKANPAGWVNRFQRRRIHFWNEQYKNQEAAIQRGDLPEKTARIDVAAKVQEDVKQKTETMDFWAQERDYLHGKKLHTEARLDLDRMSMYRINAATSEKAELEQFASGSVPELDRAEWAALYRHDKEWGKAVSQVEETIVRIGRGEIEVPGVANARQLYVQGFKSTKDFVSWLKVLSEKSVIRENEGVQGMQAVDVKRMDVIMAAWKLALTKGLVAKESWSIKNGKFDFGDPPFATDMETKFYHSEKKRAQEAGWPATDVDGNVMDLDEREVVKFNADGSKTVILSAKWGDDPLGRKRAYFRHGTALTEEELARNNAKYLRHLEEKYIAHVKPTPVKKVDEFGNPYEVAPYANRSHSGNTLTVGRIVRTFDDYLSSVRLENWVDPRSGRTYKNITLADIYFELGMNLSDESFPWMSIEDRPRDTPTDNEMAPGTMGFWGLVRARAAGNRADTLLILDDARKMKDEFFNTGGMRAKGKLKVISPSRLMEVTVNGRKIKILGDNSAGMWLLEKLIETSPFLYGDGRLDSVNHMPNEMRVNPKRVYQSKTRTGTWEYSPRDNIRDGAISILSILRNARDAGMISKEEAEHIYEGLVPPNERLKARK